MLFMFVGFLTALFGAFLIFLAGPIALVIMLIMGLVFAHQAAILIFATFLIPAELVVMLFRWSTLLWTPDGAYSAAYDNMLSYPFSFFAWAALLLGGFSISMNWQHRGAFWDDFKQGMASFSAKPAAAALPAPVKSYSLNPEVNAAIAAVMSGATYKTAAVAQGGQTDRQRKRDQDQADSKRHDADFNVLITEMQNQVNDPNSAFNIESRRKHAEDEAAIARGEAYRVVRPDRGESPELIWAHIPGLIGGVHSGLTSVVKGVGMATVAAGTAVGTVGVIRKLQGKNAPFC